MFKSLIRTHSTLLKRLTKRWRKKGAREYSIVSTRIKVILKQKYASAKQSIIEFNKEYPSFYQAIYLPYLYYKECRKGTPPSLAKDVSKKVKALYKNNDFLREISRKQPLWLMRMPYALIAGSLFISVSLSLISYLYEENCLHGVSIIFELLKLPSDYIASIFGVQATVIGVIYPIVLGLIQFLFQGRYNSVLLEIYYKASLARRLGISSVSFLLILGTLAFFSADNHHIEIALSSLVWTWFSYNIVLTWHFLDFTLDFIGPKFRHVAVLRSFANLFWKDELYEELYALNCRGLVYGYAEDLIGRVISSSNRRLIECSFVTTTIKDVRLRFAICGLRLWLRRHPSEEYTKTIYINYMPNHDMPDNTINHGLVSAETGNLSFIEKLVFSLSWVEGKLSNRIIETVNSSRIVEDVSHDLIRAIQGDNKNEFDDSLTRLRNTLTFLVKISHNPRDNDFFTETGRGWWPLHDLWLQAGYANVVEVAADAFPNTYYWEYMTRLTYWLLQDGYNNQMRIEGRIRYIKLLPQSFYKLFNIWKKSLNEPVDTFRSSRPMKLPLGLDNSYNHALRGYVGASENVTSSLLKTGSREDSLSFKEEDINILVESYLSLAYPLVLSVFNGDQTASQWLQEALLNWNKQLQSGVSNTYRAYAPLVMLLNVYDSKDQYADFIAKATSQRSYVRITFRECLVTSLNHFWEDLCLTVVLILIAGSSDDENDLAITTTGNILLGRTISIGADDFSGSSLRPIRSASAILAALIRITLNDAYASRLESVSDRLSRETEPERVTGRVYSLRGSNDLQSYLHQLAILLLCFEPNNLIVQEISESLDYLSSQSDNAPYRGILDVLQKLSQQLSQLNFAEHGKKVSRLSEVTLNEKKFDERKTSFISQLESLVNNLTQAQRDYLTQTQVLDGNEELIERAKAFESGFIQSPILNLFSSITNTKLTRVDVKEFSVTGIPKAELLGRSQKAMNSFEYYSSMGKHYGEIFLLREALNRRRINLNANTSKAFWNILNRESAKILDKGLTPILLVKGSSLPQWLYYWLRNFIPEYEQNKGIYLPKNLKGYLADKKDVENNPGFIGRLNGIDIYESPFNQEAILLAKEWLIDVSLHKAKKDSPLVKASFIADPNDTLKGKIRFGFKFKLTLKMNGMKFIIIQFKEE